MGGFADRSRSGFCALASHSLAPAQHLAFPTQALGPLAALVETARLFTCGPIPCPGSPLVSVLGLLALVLVLVALGSAGRGSGTGDQGRGVLLPLLWLLAPLMAMVGFGNI